ncbi:MAG: phycobilisome linker polypeptide [Spirulinaceae cyanobacterium]
MLGQAFLGRSNGSSSASSRIFAYEVTGLPQNNGNNKKEDYRYRPNGNSILIKVPYNRMNEEMKRITRMGGTIVSIKPWNSFSESDSES